MNLQTMNRQRKYILIAAVAGIISVFLPWTSISVFGISQSTNGFHGWGVLAFLCFVVCGLLSLGGNQSTSLEKNSWFISIVCGGAALLAVIIAAKSSSSEADGGLGLVDTSISAGIYMAIAAAAGILLAVWLYKAPADNLRSGFESLKKSISIPATSSTATTRVINAPTDDIEKVHQTEAKS
jgi:hypothetical protein